MIKYILQSGGVANNLPMKKKFHQEVVKGLGENPKILMCNFWQHREFWDVKYEGYCDSIREDVDCAPEFQLAMPDTFEDQIRWADVVYCHGGDDYLGMFWLQKFDVPQIFEGKIVATNSGSSDALSANFWPNDWRKPIEGLGVLPIKFMPHYGAQNPDDLRGDVDWGRAEQELAAFGDTSLPIYKPREGEFVVFEDGKEVSVHAE